MSWSSFLSKYVGWLYSVNHCIHSLSCNSLLHPPMDCFQVLSSGNCFLWLLSKYWNLWDDVPFKTTKISACLSKIPNNSFPFPNPSQILLMSLFSPLEPSSASWGHLNESRPNRLDLLTALLFFLSFPLPACPWPPADPSSYLATSNLSDYFQPRASPCSLSPLIVEAAISCSLGIQPCLVRCSYQIRWPAWRWMQDHSLQPKCLPSRAL